MKRQIVTVIYNNNYYNFAKVSKIIACLYPQTSVIGKAIMFKYHDRKRGGGGDMIEGYYVLPPNAGSVANNAPVSNTDLLALAASEKQIGSSS